MATGGIVLGVLAVVVSLAVIAVWVRVFGEVGVPAYVDCVSKTSERQGIEKCADELRQRVEDELGITLDASPLVDEMASTGHELQRQQHEQQWHDLAQRQATYRRSPSAWNLRR